MRIPSRDDQIALGGDKPIKLLKPEGLSLREVLSKVLIQFLLNPFERILFGNFQHLLTGLLGAFLFLVVLLLALVVEGCVCVGVVVDVDLDGEQLGELLGLGSVPEQDSDLPLEDVHVVDHVG